MEAETGIEPVVGVLQTPALPLGYPANISVIFYFILTILSTM